MKRLVLLTLLGVLVPAIALAGRMPGAAPATPGPTPSDRPTAGTPLPVWTASVTQGDLPYGSAANMLGLLPKSTSSTRYLSNTGTSNNPAWAQVDVTNGVTGALPIVNGGTGQTTADAAFSALAMVSYPNDTTTGTLTNGLVKFTAAGKVIKTDTTDQGGAIGICKSGCGTSGSALIQIGGASSCVFENATTFGNWITIGTGTRGNCRDAGSTFPVTGEVVGLVTETGAAGTRTLYLLPVMIDAMFSRMGATIDAGDLAQNLVLLAGNVIDFNSGANMASLLLPRHTSCSGVSSLGGFCFNTSTLVLSVGNASTIEDVVMVHGKQTITGPIAVYDKNFPTPTQTATITPTPGVTPTAATPTPTATRTPEFASNYVALDTITLLRRIIPKDSSSTVAGLGCLASDLSNTCHFTTTDNATFGGSLTQSTDRNFMTFSTVGGQALSCGVTPFGVTINACTESPDGGTTAHKLSTTTASTGAAATAVTNTTSETTIVGAITNGTLTLPANYWRQGKAIRISVSGTLSTDSTAATLNFKVKGGGSTILCSTGLQAPTNSLSSRYFKLDALLQSRAAPGASVNIYCNGLVTIMPAATSTAAVLWELSSTAQPVSLATNAAQALDVTVTMANTPNTNDIVTGQIAVVEALN